MTKGEITFSVSALQGKYEKGYHKLDGLFEMSNDDELYLYKAVGLDVGEYQATVYFEGLIDDIDRAVND